MTPEFDFIAAIRRQVPQHPEVLLGIGDDAAVLRPTGDRPPLVTTDLLAEGVHFTANASPEDIGYKALAVNLSDLAAMGATPTAAFVSVCLPRDRGRNFADRLSAAILELADSFGVSIAGGDTNSWNGPLVINIALVGLPVTSRPILRSGAKPGDAIFVTGHLGGSIHGRHLRPQLRIAESKFLCEHFAPHAMIDVSDGLAADLQHILEESHCGAVLESAQIPIHDDVDRRISDADRLRHALHDGEDFELVFTLNSKEAERLSHTTRPFETPVTRIGTIVEGSQLTLRQKDGAVEPLAPLGWSHPL